MTAVEVGALPAPAEEEGPRWHAIGRRCPPQAARQVDRTREVTRTHDDVDIAVRATPAVGVPPGDGTTLDDGVRDRRLVKRG